MTPTACIGFVPKPARPSAFSWVIVRRLPEGGSMYAERRPFDGAWLWSGLAKYATPLTFDVALRIAEHLSDGNVDVIALTADPYRRVPTEL